LILFLISFSFSLQDEHIPTKKSILNIYMDKKPKEIFKVYHFIYEKKYSLNSEEALKRFKNFKLNLEHINKRNSQNLSFKLALNEFSDFSLEEVKEKMLKRKTRESIKKFITETPNFVNEDKEEELLKRTLTQKTPIDWSQYMLPPRHQGFSCGSCWAFSTVAALEACVAIKNNSRSSEYLSVQQLIDCDKQDMGCFGGFYDLSFTYLKQNGVMLEKDYPYAEEEQTCKYDSNKVAARITGVTACSHYGWITKCTSDIVYNIVRLGTAAVGVDGNTRDFMNYSEGVMDDPDCKQDNHSVLLVGYGVENGKEYWLIRNTWGESWGNRGYGKVMDNPTRNNSCFVTNEAYQI